MNSQAISDSVMTVTAPKHLNIYEDILAAHSRLQALESRLAIPVRV